MTLPLSSESVTTGDSAPVQPHPPAASAALVGAVVGWSALLGALAAGIAASASALALAAGIVFGTCVGALNVALLARVLTGVLANPFAHAGPAGQPAVRRALLVKWPLVLGLLIAGLHFGSADPLGIVFGIACSLAGASIGVTRVRARARAATEPQP